MDYSSLGLNQQLQPINSPVAQNGVKFVNGLDFDSNYDRGVITGAKLGNFSFNAGTGGTISLGGTLNGDGYLEVKNASGSVIVVINNDGIAVTGGSVSIKNSAGTTILDSTGLVSSANFVSGQGSTTAAGTLTSTSFVEVPNGSVGASIALTRSSQVQINALVNCYHPDFDGVVVGQVYEGVNEIGPKLITHGFGPDSGADSSLTTSMSFIQTLSAGTRDIHLKVRQNNNPGTAYFNTGAGNVAALVSYVILGS